MPSWDLNEYSPARARLQKAWESHYVAKGCNQYRAWQLAMTKTHTWPPSSHAH